MKIPSSLNEVGQAHVEARLAEVGLDWSLDRVCSEIEGKSGFMSLTPGDSYEYEISNISAGIKSYGAFAYIEIDADKHVTWVEADA